MKSKKKYLNYFILILLLIFTFLKTYQLHNNHRFPYHHDEWQHLALSIQATEEGYNKQHNPYLNEPNFHADLEPGFHLYLSSFFLMTDLNPILTYQYFAAIFAVIAGFTIFLCMYRLSKQFIIGILSLIVYISLPTNVNILGKNFFIPLTMAISFMFLFIFYFIVSLKEKNYKKFFFSIIVLALIFFIHPPSFLILLIPAFFELISNFEFIKQIKTPTKFWLSLIMIFFFFFSIALAWKGSIQGTIGYIRDLLFFERGWGKLEVTFFIPLLYGLINTFFAILGFVKGYKTKLRFFVVLAFFSLAITSMFNVFGFSYIVPYSRAIHYAMLGLVPLTAYGFFVFVKSMIKFLNFEEKKLSTKIFSSISVIIFFVLILNSKYDLNQKYIEYNEPVIYENDYKTLVWIKNNLAENNIFVTPYFMTSAVYPISKNQVISIIPAQLDGGLIKENLNFYAYSCDDKKVVINQSKARYLLSRTEQKCVYLKEIHSENNYIYEII